MLTECASLFLYPYKLIESVREMGFDWEINGQKKGDRNSATPFYEYRLKIKQYLVLA